MVITASTSNVLSVKMELKMEPMHLKISDQIQIVIWTKATSIMIVSAMKMRMMASMFHTPF
jgi:hypothetical protein